MANHTGKGAVRFPRARHPAFNFLHKYIHTTLWPHWTKTKRRQFAQHTSKLLVFNPAIVNVAMFIRRPSNSHILEKPYSIVTVTTGIAIWGLTHVNKCADMPAFLEEHAQRLEAFQKVPAPGYGKPAASMNKNLAHMQDPLKEDDDGPSEELTSVQSDLPQNHGDGSIPSDAAEAIDERQPRVFKLPTHPSMTTLTLALEASPNKVPSRHERRSHGVECHSDHCLQHRAELQDTAQQALEARDKLQVENETLQATLAKLQQSTHNTVHVPFAEIWSMTMNANNCTADSLSPEQRKKGFDELVNAMNKLYGRVAQLMGSAT